MNDKNIWFPAKKYGVGWGLPITWQGWAIFLGYLALVFIGGLLLVVFDSPILIIPFVVYIFILTGLLIFICYKKGEKLDFRWGNKK